MKNLTGRDQKLARWFLASLAFLAIGYTLFESGLRYLETRSLPSLALAVACILLLVVQVIALRNPKWPQRLW
jgi:hypothetical protein